jgi:hypothetical protein
MRSGGEMMNEEFGRGGRERSGGRKRRDGSILGKMEGQRVQ